jgi:hypothetical protein
MRAAENQLKFPRKLVDKYVGKRACPPAGGPVKALKDKRAKKGKKGERNNHGNK